jgi:hypothetical protein
MSRRDPAIGCIQAISGMTGQYVDQLEFHMHDGAHKLLGENGVSAVIPSELEPEEMVTSVTQVEHGSFIGTSIIFETSTGQKIGLEGYAWTGKKWNTHRFQAGPGEQICDVSFIRGCPLV